MAKNGTSNTKAQVCGQFVSICDNYGELSADKYDHEQDRWFVCYQTEKGWHVQENLKDGNIGDVGDYGDFVSALIALAGAGLHGQTYPVYEMAA